MQHSAISQNPQGGTDTVTLEGQAKDYTVSWSESDPYGLTLSSSKYGIKELHGIDQLNFQGDFLSEILHLGKSEFNVANGKITRNDFVSNWFDDPKSAGPIYDSAATHLLSAGKA